MFNLSEISDTKSFIDIIVRKGLTSFLYTGIHNRTFLPGDSKYFFKCNFAHCTDACEFNNEYNKDNNHQCICLTLPKNREVNNFKSLVEQLENLRKTNVELFL